MCWLNPQCTCSAHRAQRISLYKQRARPSSPPPQISACATFILHHHLTLQSYCHAAHLNPRGLSRAAFQAGGAQEALSIPRTPHWIEEIQSRAQTDTEDSITACADERLTFCRSSMKSSRQRPSLPRLDPLQSRNLNVFKLFFFYSRFLEPIRQRVIQQEKERLTIVESISSKFVVLNAYVFDFAVVKVLYSSLKSHLKRKWP